MFTVVQAETTGEPLKKSFVWGAINLVKHQCPLWRIKGRRSGCCKEVTAVVEEGNYFGLD